MEGCLCDIDGVLIHGRNAIDNCKETILKLLEKEIPLVFITNGGGVPRSIKGQQIADILKLDASIICDRLINSHDPIKPFLEPSERVLVISKTEQYSRGVAKEWELENFCVIEDFEREMNAIFPVSDDGHDLDRLEKEQRVDVICIVATPQSWGHSLQLVVDLLRHNGYVGKGKAEPNKKVI